MPTRETDAHSLAAGNVLTNSLPTSLPPFISLSLPPLCFYVDSSFYWAKKAVKQLSKVNIGINFCYLSAVVYLLAFMRCCCCCCVCCCCCLQLFAVATTQPFIILRPSAALWLPHTSRVENGAHFNAFLSFAAKQVQFSPQQ